MSLEHEGLIYSNGWIPKDGWPCGLEHHRTCHLLPSLRWHQIILLGEWWQRQASWKLVKSCCTESINRAWTCNSWIILPKTMLQIVYIVSQSLYEPIFKLHIRCETRCDINQLKCGYMYRAIFIHLNIISSKITFEVRCTVFSCNTVKVNVSTYSTTCMQCKLDRDENVAL